MPTRSITRSRSLSPCSLNPDLDFLVDEPVVVKEKEQSKSAEKNVGHQNGTFNYQESSTEHKILNQIHLSLDKYTQAYHRVMNQLLPSSGHSIDSAEVTLQHETTFSKLNELLESDLKLLAEHFMSILKARVDKELKNVLQLNKKRSMEEVQVKGEISKEMKKLDAEKEIKNIDEKTRKRKTETIKERLSPKGILENDDNIQLSPISNDKKMGKQINTPVPILMTTMEFSFAFVKLGFKPQDGGFSLLKNSTGEECTPTFVAVNKNGDICIGTEAKNEVDRNSLKRFSLGELIRASSDSQRNYHFFMNGELKSVDWTLLFSVFLAKLKQDMERLEGRSITIGGIVVPLCLNFHQRTSLLNAIEISGFGRPTMINDTGAIARHLSSIISEGHVLVVISGMNHFDAAIYEVELNHVTLLSSCGNYHSGKPNENKSLGDFSVAPRNWLSWVTRNHDLLLTELSDIAKPYLKILKKVVYIDHSGTNYLRGIVDEIGGGGKAFDAQIEGEKHSILQSALIYRTQLAEVDPDFNLETCPPIYPFGIMNDDGTVDELDFKNEGDTAATAATSKLNNWTPSSFIEISFDIHHNPKPKIKVAQKVAGKYITIGELIILRTSVTIEDDATKASLNLNFSLCPDGMRAGVACKIFSDADATSELHELQHGSEYLWKPQNNELSTTALDFKTIAATMNKDMVKEGVILLEELINEIRPLIIQVRSLVGKKLLENCITEAEALLIHPNSTLEMIKKKTEMMSMLKNKYRLS